MSNRIIEVRQTLAKRHVDIREAIAPRITEWIAQNATLQSGDFDVGQLIDAARFAAASCADEIGEIARDCFDHEIFPDIPAVKLYGCDGRGDKIWDFWLMMWRRGPQRPEATRIHDHGNSYAGIYVVKGAVSEYVYHIDPTEWAAGKADKENEGLQFSISRRVLCAGDTAFIPVPYIHRMIDHQHEGYSVHAYGNPPLDDQVTYVLAGDRLYSSGTWSETGEGCVEP